MIDTEEALDLKKSKSVKKYLKYEKFMLIKDIGKSFDLAKIDNDYVRSKIMAGFWRGEHNLFSLPWYSQLIKIPRSLLVKINGKQILDPIVITRGALKSLLCNEITGKKKIKKRPNQVSERFEFIDEDDKIYKNFLREDWKFYQRIINRINRNFKNALGQICPDKTKQKVNDVIDAADGNYIKLYTLNTLAIEITDLIDIMNQLSYLPNGGAEKIGSIRKILASLSNVLYIKKGHYITNEMIFNMYLTCKKYNPKKSDTEISLELYKKYFEDFGLNSKISSSDRIRKIINERKKIEIFKSFELQTYKTSMELEKLEDLYSFLATYFFTTVNHVKKLHEQYQHKFKNLILNRNL